MTAVRLPDCTALDYAVGPNVETKLFVEAKSQPAGVGVLAGPPLPGKIQPASADCPSGIRRDALPAICVRTRAAKADGSAS